MRFDSIIYIKKNKLNQFLSLNQCINEEKKRRKNYENSGIIKLKSISITKEATYKNFFQKIFFSILFCQTLNY